MIWAIVGVLLGCGLRGVISRVSDFMFSFVKKCDFLSKCVWMIGENCGIIP